MHRSNDQALVSVKRNTHLVFIELDQKFCSIEITWSIYLFRCLRATFLKIFPIFHRFSQKIQRLRNVWKLCEENGQYTMESWSSMRCASAVQFNHYEIQSSFVECHQQTISLGKQALASWQASEESVCLQSRIKG